MRGLPFGGNGNAPILVVLRKVLPGVGIAEDGGEGEAPVPSPLVGVVSAVFSVGTAGVERVFRVGRPEVVTDRIDGLGMGDDEAGVGLAGPWLKLGRTSMAFGTSGRAFLVLDTGRAGSGAEGGESGEVEGRRMPVVEDIVRVADMAGLAAGCVSGRVCRSCPPFLLCPSRPVLLVAATVLPPTSNSRRTPDPAYRPKCSRKVRACSRPTEKTAMTAPGTPSRLLRAPRRSRKERRCVFHTAVDPCGAVERAWKEGPPVWC